MTQEITSFATDPPAVDPASASYKNSGEIARPPADWHATVKQPVFVVEDSFFRSRTPSPMHWSVAWSDVMMTMFILFLSLFVYQLAHRNFLDQDKVEVVGGTTIPLPPQVDNPGITPFHPISPQLSKKPSDPLQKVERIEEKTLIADDTLADKEIPIKIKEKPIKLEPPEPVYQIKQEELLTETTVPKQSEKTIIVEPLQQAASEKQPDKQPARQPQEVFTRMYDLSKVTLEREKLERFASVELVPDKAMRIILTGDLLFASGEAILTSQAEKSLKKLSAIIAQTPYMINVVGHTDSVPMHSAQFPSNWELSVARASTVARFLIEEMRVPGKQIVVSGFSYFRPLRPNDTEQNRSANRRVEIILSKEPPPASRSTQ